MIAFKISFILLAVASVSHAFVPFAIDNTFFDPSDALQAGFLGLAGGQYAGAGVPNAVAAGLGNGLFGLKQSTKEQNQNPREPQDAAKDIPTDLKITLDILTKFLVNSLKDILPSVVDGLKAFARDRKLTSLVAPIANSLQRFGESITIKAAPFGEGIQRTAFRDLLVPVIYKLLGRFGTVLLNALLQVSLGIPAKILNQRGNGVIYQAYLNQDRAKDAGYQGSLEKTNYYYVKPDRFDFVPSEYGYTPYST